MPLSKISQFFFKSNFFPASSNKSYVKNKKNKIQELEHLFYLNSALDKRDSMRYINTKENTSQSYL